MDLKKIGKKTTKNAVLSQKTNRNRPNLLILVKNPRTLIENRNLIEKFIVNHIDRHILSRFENLWEIRRLVLFWLLLIAGLLVSLGFFSNFAHNGYMQNTFIDGGIYAEGTIGEVKNLNPIFASTEPERIFSKLAFSRLFDIDVEGKLKKQLVDKIETTSNFKDFNLNLRQDAEWSDGRKITADDVEFTVGLLKDKVINPSRWQAWKNVEVRKISDYALNFKTPTESSLVLHSLDFPILPKHKLSDIEPDKMRENDFSKKPVTSGAFNFDMLQKNAAKTTISLIKNNRYFLGGPRLDRFEIVAYDSTDNLKTALKNAEVSAASDVFADQIEANNIHEKQVPINRGIYAFLNNTSSMLSNIKIRQAIQYGVDIAKIRSQMRAVDELKYPVLDDLVNKDEVILPDYKIEEANKLLEAEGWKKDGNSLVKGGQKATLNITTTNDSNLEKAANELKKQLEELGFQVNLSVANKDDRSGGFLQSVIQPRNYDILLYEVSFGSDADFYGLWHSSQTGIDGWNLSNYKDFVADDILLNARKINGEDNLKEKFTSFTNRWLRSAPALPIARGKFVYSYHSGVMPFGDIKMTDSLNRFSDVIYWRAKKGYLYRTP